MENSDLGKPCHSPPHYLGAPGRPHKGSALAGRRGNVSSDPTAWSGAPAEGAGLALQGNRNEGGAPVVLLRRQEFN